MDSMYFLPSGISLALLLLETLICVVATVGSCLIQNIFCILYCILCVSVYAGIFLYISPVDRKFCLMS
ncbi:unnamed protein product, partial [Schistosoma margrebowiei]